MRPVDTTWRTRVNTALPSRPCAEGSVLCLGAAVLSAASACGSSQANSLQGKTPDSVLNASSDAAVRFEGVHYVLQTTSDGHKQTVTGDARANAGAQSIVIGSDQTVVEVVGTTAYLRANARWPGGHHRVLASDRHARCRQMDLVPTERFAIPDGCPRGHPQQPALPTQTNPTLGRVHRREPCPDTRSSECAADFKARPARVRQRSGSPPRRPTCLWAPTPRSLRKDNKTVTEVGVFSKWGERFRVRAPSGSCPSPRLGRSN